MEGSGCYPSVSNLKPSKMILGFSHVFKGTTIKTGFEEKILAKNKIHSLRKGNRWRAGNSIQMAIGVRTKKYRQFNTDRPDLQLCRSTQRISLTLSHYMNDRQIIVDGRELSIEEMILLAHNDGFDTLAQFWMWFDDEDKFPNQIVHWTDFKY